MHLHSSSLDPPTPYRIAGRPRALNAQARGWSPRVGSCDMINDQQADEKLISKITETYIPELSNFQPLRRVYASKLYVKFKRGAHSHLLSLVYCRISRWNIVEPVQPITAHQYTSTGAKIKSSRRFLARPLPCSSVAFGYNEEKEGNEKTVSAFSRVSQWAVFGREEGARNDDRSTQKRNVFQFHGEM